MIILEVWKNKVSAIWGLIILILILFWPALILKSFRIWFKTLFSPSLQSFLYFLFAFLVGSYFALMIYDRKVKKCCQVKNIKGVIASSLLGLFAGLCPACLPILGFFLPLSLGLILGYYSNLILLISLILLFFFLWRAGAFRK